MKIFCLNGETKFMQRDITKQGIKQFILSLNGSEILEFFFLGSSNLWCLFLMIILYYQIKTLIGFCYKWGLNFLSLIQLSKILLIKLTRTHK